MHKGIKKKKTNGIKKGDPADGEAAWELFQLQMRATKNSNTGHTTHLGPTCLRLTY